MKHSIETLLNAVVNDNYNYIKESEGTIADWLLLNTREEEYGYYFFLTNDEIEEFENNKTRKNELIEEVESYVIENFAYLLK